MYGVMSSTTDAMRIKSAYTEDALIDMCVLESIVQPAPDAPFESMVVRWSLYAVPIYVRLLVNHQDAVYIEMTGMRQLSNGERVGFHLAHSVAFDKTPAFKAYDRVNTSNCTILRQTSSDRVELYVTTFLEIKDSIMVGSLVKTVADSLLSNVRTIECARLKKLSWLVQEKGVLAKREANSVHTSDQGCSVCGSQHRLTRRGIKSVCAVCSKNSCKKCRVKQTIHFFAPDGQLLKREMRFCVPCIKAASNMDAAVVAADEAATGLRPVKYGSGGYNAMFHTISSSSSLSGGGDSSLSGGGDSPTNLRRADSEYSITANQC
jgi:hypothetical protein